MPKESKRVLMEGDEMIVVSDVHYGHTVPEGSTVTVRDFDPSDNTYYCQDQNDLMHWISFHDMEDPGDLDAEIAEVVARLTGQPIPKRKKKKKKPKKPKKVETPETMEESFGIFKAWKSPKFSRSFVLTMIFIFSGLACIQTLTNPTLAGKISGFTLTFCIAAFIYLTEALRIYTWIHAERSKV